MSLTPTLEIVDYSDPDNSPHKQTRWWIATDNEFNNLVWEKSDNTGDMLSQQVDAGVLQPNTTYYWRAVFQDNTNLWGYWSNPWSFSTTAPKPPSAPQLKLPANGSGGVGAAPTLELMGFSDPDGDTQQNTQWQIATDSAFLHIAAEWLDSDAEKLRETLPGPLAWQTTYYWRAKVQDSTGLWSDWSAAWRFNTGDEAGHFPNGPTLKSPLAGSTM